MSKNIVVLSDGTGQDGGKGHDSNIYKLYRMLEDRTEDQIVYYDQGLGTDWRRISGNAFGVGFSKNVLQCYHFIFENYNAGDRIFLFGFSRGAATVRSLASFIHYFGILARSRTVLIGMAYKLYRSLGKNLYDKAEGFTTAHPSMWADVEFLGVWDTVPALGVIPLAGLNLVLDRLPGLKHSFHDFALHPSIKNAYQALSIDDDREWFLPTVWNQYGDEDKQQIKQVWFSGCHTDVGGGYKEAGLSDIALEWMVKSAMAHGVRLYLGSRKYWNFCIAPDETDLSHDPRSGFGRVFKAGARDKVWDEKAVETFGPPVVHESVLKRAKEDPNYRPWILKNYGIYPDPEEYLRSTYDAEIEKELKRRYLAWCAEEEETGVPNLVDYEAWAADNPLSYEQWLLENHLEVQACEDIGEFKGRKFLVERDEVTSLRDYDKNTFDEKSKQSDLDYTANDNLLQRGIINKRIDKDQVRWGKAKNGQLKK